MCASSAKACEVEIESYRFVFEDHIAVFDATGAHVFNLSFENVNESAFMEDLKNSSISDKEMIIRVLKMMTDPVQRMKEISKMSCTYKEMPQLLFQNVIWTEE